MCTSHDVEDNTQNGDPRSGYVLAEDWPRYPPEMHFEMGSGVAVDEHGTIYLFTRDLEHWAAHPLAMSAKMGKSTVSMFNRDSDYLGKWGCDESHFNGPTAVVVQADGTIVVAYRYWNSRLAFFAPDGGYIDEWTHIMPLSLAT